MLEVWAVNMCLCLLQPSTIVVGQPCSCSKPTHELRASVQRWSSLQTNTGPPAQGWPPTGSPWKATLVSKTPAPPLGGPRCSHNCKKQMSCLLSLHTLAFVPVHAWQMPSTLKQTLPQQSMRGGNAGAVDGSFCTQGALVPLQAQVYMHCNS